MSNRANPWYQLVAAKTEILLGQIRFFRGQPPAIALIKGDASHSPIPHFIAIVKNKADIYSHDNLLYPQGELTDAETSYRQAIAREPNNPTAYYNLGVVLDERYLLQEAISNYRQAIVLKPDYVKAYSNLGCVLLKLDKLFEAIEVIRQAIDGRLSHCLVKQKRPGAAVVVYQIARIIQLDAPSPYFQLEKVRANSIPKGVVSAKDWVVRVKFNGAIYISTLQKSRVNAS